MFERWTVETQQRQGESVSSIDPGFEGAGVRMAAREVLQVEEGSLYPALYRLENQGLVHVQTWTTDFSLPVGLGALAHVKHRVKAIGQPRYLGLPHLLGAGELPR